MVLQRISLAHNRAHSGLAEWKNWNAEMLRKRCISIKDSRSNECALVAKALAFSIETLLGTGKSLKCCTLSGSSILTGSTPKILETIDIQHPAGFLINTACQSFQKEFGCGSTTLVCMIGYWTGALQDLADMGVPVTVIVSVLDEIADELENILKRSCISLGSIEGIGFDESVFHRNLSSRHVFDKHLEYSKPICDETTTCVKEGSEGNAELQAVNETANLLDFTHGTNAKSSSQMRELREYSVLKYPSPACKSFSSNEAEETIVEDEFDCCFEGLDLREKCPGSSTPTSSLIPHSSKMETLIRKKSSTFAGEKKSGECVLDLKSGTFGVLRSGFNLKQSNANVKLSQIHNSDLFKDHHLLHGVSGNLQSAHKHSENHILANGKIRKVTNVKNVLLRSRHLLDCLAAESSELSHTKGNDVEWSHKSKTFASGCNKVSNSSNSSAIFKADYAENIKQRSPNITHESCQGETKGSYLVTCQRIEHWLDSLSRSLAREKESEMSLALEILKKQFSLSRKDHREFSFQMDHIIVQTVLGPSVSNTCLRDGAVVELSKENQFIVACDPDTPRQIALVKGDIIFKYRHPGFQDSVQVTHTLNKDDLCHLGSHVRSEWMDRVILLIKRLNLGVVAIHGHMSSELRNHMQAVGVIVLENLSNEQLDVLSKLTGTSMLSYILDLTAHDLGKLVVMRMWDSGWSSGKLSTRSNVFETFVFAQIYLTPGEQFSNFDSAVYSAVICGPVKDLADDSERKFWNCAHRLRNAFEDQYLLPGGGDIERICVKHLEDIRDSRPPGKSPISSWIQSEDSEYWPLIIDAICSGLKQFVARTNSNINMVLIHKFSSSPVPSAVSSSKTVYDNYICKVEGWKRAIRIVKLFLNSEYCIITGL